MHTVKTSHLSGYDRVRRYVTENRSIETIWLTHYDVIKQLKTRFYFLEVKMAAARQGKQKAINLQLESFSNFVNQGLVWVATQNQDITNFEKTEFEVELIGQHGASLLRLFMKFDNLLTQLVAAQYAGGQPDNLRINYVNTFTGHISVLLNIANSSDASFLTNGTQRNLVLT